MPLLASSLLMLGEPTACRSAQAEETAVPSPAEAPTERILDFEIKSGPADRSLHDFALQAQVGLLYDSDATKGVETHAVNGRFSAMNALHLLLEHTGLSFVLANDETVTIVSDATSFDSRESTEPITVSPVKVSARSLDSADVTIRTNRIQPWSMAAGAEPIALYVRPDIDRSGAYTVESFLRTQPQIFGGGATEDTSLGREAQSNAMRGYGINLRGLDSAETLVLLNGRRMAPSGSVGAFVDVSNIPLSAVKRIELLPEAQQTPYGSDGAGGVVNFVMQDDFKGVQAEGRFGAVTQGALQEHQYSFLAGTGLNGWRPGNVMVALEYEKRDALAAADRPQATSNFEPWGGLNYGTPFGNPGNIITATGLAPIPHAQDGASLFSSPPVAGKPNLYDQYLGATVLPSQLRRSALATINFELTDQIETYAEVLANERTMETSSAAQIAPLTIPTKNAFLAPYNLQDPVQELYGFAADLGPLRVGGRVKTVNASAGLNWHTEGWRYTGYFGYTAEKEYQLETGLVNFAKLDDALASKDPLTAFNPFGDGSFTKPEVLKSIGAEDIFASDSHQRVVNLGADRDLAKLNAGALRLASGLEYREQVFDSHVRQTYPATDVSMSTRRRVESGFAQLRAPFFGPEARRRWLERLELSAAIRVDHFSDVGSAFSPMYGMAWSPVSNLLLRSTWSRSYRPPNLPDRVEQTDVSGIVTLPDPANSSRNISALAWAGNNTELAPERSQSWTVGATFGPTLLPQSSIAVTYFDIKFRDKIDYAALTANGLANPALDGRVIWSPSDSLRNQACQYATNPQQCLAAPVDALVDLRLQNTSVVRTRGIDLLAKLDRETARGNVGLRVAGTYLFQYGQSYSRNGQVNDLLNTQNYPVSLRLHSSAHWRYRDFEISHDLSYTHGYRNTATDPASSVGGWTTTDLNLSYAPQHTDLSWAAGATLFVGVRNLFDHYPPFVDNRKTWIGYDQENGDLLGRFVSIGIRKNW